METLTELFGMLFFSVILASMLTSFVIEHGKKIVHAIRTPYEPPKKHTVDEGFDLFLNDLKELHERVVQNLSERETSHDNAEVRAKLAVADLRSFEIRHKELFR